MTSACACVRDGAGADRLRGAGRRRARPHADDRQGGAGRSCQRPICCPISRRSCHVYNLMRPARQQVQGAAQDPRARERHRSRPRAVEAEFRTRSAANTTGVSARALAEIEAAFAPPAFDAPEDGYDAARAADPVFRAWIDTNVAAHRAPDYAIVTVSLKPIGGTPGDATAEQMRLSGRSGRDLRP